MKSLLDIQRKIRVLEQQMNVLANAITEIYKDIDNLRNDEVALIDYKKIQLLSTHIKFKNHPLGNLTNKKLCQAYIELLLRVVHLDKDIESTTDRLAFVQWVIKQAKLDLGLEELFIGALKRDTDNLILAIEFFTTTYQNQLLLDMLLVANITGKANEEILSFIADLCGFFAVTRDKLKAFSVIAKNILLQKNNKTDYKNVLSDARQFEHYLDSSVLTIDITEQRVLVAKIYEGSTYERQWNKSTGYVYKGSLICTYRNFLKPNDSNKFVIKSPCEGQLYVFKERNVHYVVVHHADDSQAAVRAWALTRR